MNRTRLFAIVLACLAVSCTGTGVTMGQAQATLDQWVKSDPGVPSGDGAVAVASILAGPAEGQATAELRLTSFPDQDGHTSPTVDPGRATFSQRSDGRWVLISVVWDEGRRVAMPNLEVQ